MSDELLPINDEPVPVPVFTVHAILRTDENGTVTARAAALDGLSVTAANERDALLKIVDQFKALARECLEKKQPIPFIDPPEAPADGEAERWIPVHL